VLPNVIGWQYRGCSWCRKYAVTSRVGEADVGSFAGGMSGVAKKMEGRSVGGGVGGTMGLL